MSDQLQQQQQKQKADPVLALQKIEAFLGEDITKGTKLSRSMLEEAISEFHAEELDKLKGEVKQRFHAIINAKRELIKAEKEFIAAKQKVGEQLNKELQFLVQKIDKVQKDRDDTAAIVAGLGNVPVDEVTPPDVSDFPASDTEQ